MGFLVGGSSTPTAPVIPAAPPAALPATMANTAVASTAANQRVKALQAAAGTSASANPDIAGGTTTTSPKLLGP